MTKFIPEDLGAFMRESNKIEGEVNKTFPDIGRLNPGDLEAAKFALDADFDKPENILKLHGMLGKYLEKDWVGKWRTCNVQVGRHVAPHHKDVEDQMRQFCQDWKRMESWEAHNAFETIHPFRDLNGRTGRLLWLNKAVLEGYNFRIPFLQMYYYQTLDREER